MTDKVEISRADLERIDQVLQSVLLVLDDMKKILHRMEYTSLASEQEDRIGHC